MRAVIYIPLDRFGLVPAGSRWAASVRHALADPLCALTTATRQELQLRALDCCAKDAELPPAAPGQDSRAGLHPNARRYRALIAEHGQPWCFGWLRLALLHCLDLALGLDTVPEIHAGAAALVDLLARPPATHDPPLIRIVDRLEVILRSDRPSVPRLPGTYLAGLSPQDATALLAAARAIAVLLPPAAAGAARA